MFKTVTQTKTGIVLAALLDADGQRLASELSSLDLFGRRVCALERTAEAAAIQGERVSIPLADWVRLQALIRDLRAAYLAAHALYLDARMQQKEAA